MAKSSTGYMKELEALLEAGEFNSSRSDYIFDIMENRGFSASNILEHIQGGNRGLPDKYKRGGTVSRKRDSRPDYGLDAERRARMALGFKVKGGMKKAMDRKLGTWRAKKAGKKGIRGVKSGGKIMQGYKAGGKV